MEAGRETWFGAFERSQQGLYNCSLDFFWGGVLTLVWSFSTILVIFGCWVVEFSTVLSLNSWWCACCEQTALSSFFQESPAPSCCSNGVTNCPSYTVCNTRYSTVFICVTAALSDYCIFIYIDWLYFILCTYIHFKFLTFCHLKLECLCSHVFFVRWIDNCMWHTTTVLWPLSGSTQVRWYQINQKKVSPTHTYPDHQSSFIWPFYSSLDFVRDNPGELVPEGTFHHLLDFLVQNEDSSGHQQSGWTATPSRLIGAPISAIPSFFMLDALPGITLPVYPGLGQAPNMLACIPSGLVICHICM